MSEICPSTRHFARVSRTFCSDIPVRALSEPLKSRIPIPAFSGVEGIRPIDLSDMDNRDRS